MTQLLDTCIEPDTYRSPHALTDDQTSAAREAYERLGHHRLVRWEDLPEWQQAGYHRAALVDQNDDRWEGGRRPTPVDTRIPLMSREAVPRKPVDRR